MSFNFTVLVYLGWQTKYSYILRENVVEATLLHDTIACRETLFLRANRNMAGINIVLTKYSEFVLELLLLFGVY